MIRETFVNKIVAIAHTMIINPRVWHVPKFRRDNFHGWLRNLKNNFVKVFSLEIFPPYPVPLPKPRVRTLYSLAISATPSHCST